LDRFRVTRVKIVELASFGYFSSCLAFFSCNPSFAVIELVVGMIIRRSGLCGNSLALCQVAFEAKKAREIPRFARKDGAF
jgi:hypothetical protein